MTKTPAPGPEPEMTEIGKPMPAAARRALDEAAERRAAYVANEARLPKEIGGRKGLEPGRYGDWEVKGLTSDF